MKTIFLLPAIALTLLSAGCVTSDIHSGAPPSARENLKKAGAVTSPGPTRAGLYLDAAAEASTRLDSPGSGEGAKAIYNQAAAELTILLRSSSDGSLWNRTLTLPSSDGKSYRLRFAKGNRDGVWDPGYFTSFTASASVPQKSIYRRNSQDGIGGALVGVRKTDPLEAFSPLVGVTAPVTALLEFKGHEVTLSLVDPEEKLRVSLGGKQRIPAADFSAPLAYYPRQSEYWHGLMGAMRVDSYMKTTGLYMLQPYDPDRIPLIFVHGLISTPRMWRNVINEIEADASLRGRFQCWVFSYPTGNPPAYSAERLREELSKVYQLYPRARDCVLVGHSMGGLLSRMQATTVERKSWDVIGKDKAETVFARMEKQGLVSRCVTFKANPRVSRVVFICTPHRGSEVAIGSLGALGMRLITLPLDLTTTIAKSLGDSVAFATGDPNRMPSSVTGLSPANPMLKVLDGCPIQAPYHSIIGDRGRGDSPGSSDGIVAYWSASLKGARSELIVPGPHGSCELPETITELRRILHLHLAEHPRKR